MTNDHRTDRHLTAAAHADTGSEPRTRPDAVGPGVEQNGPQIAITMDTDWAPLELVRESIELVRRRGLKVTVFCTDPLEIEADELALHPNFTDVSDMRTPLRQLREAFPEAVGMRSHALFFTERLRPLYEEFGIRYDANAMQYLASRSRPTTIARGTASIPLFFMDRFHMEMSDEAERWSLERLPLQTPGLKVFDFHPIHLAINTPSVEWYDRARPHYHEPQRLRDFVYDGPGARTLFEDLLDWIAARGLPTYTLSEIHQEWTSAERGATGTTRRLRKSA